MRDFVLVIAFGWLGWKLGDWMINKLKRRIR